jgi:hypothetical protein
MEKRTPEFFLALAIILLSILLMVATHLNLLPLNFTLGPYRFTHWLSWIGTLIIAILTPTFYILRRRYPNRNSALTKTHIFSNLLAFSLISIHFAQQISRSIHPEDRTGLTMYILVSILVASGFIQRYQMTKNEGIYPPHRNRFLHISITSAFYIVVVIHVVHALGLF